MTAKLTSVEVVAWLRQQAEAYNKAADMIEGAYYPPEMGRSNLIPIPGITAPMQTVNGVHVYPKLNAFSLRERLKKRSARCGDLAKEFGVSEAAVMAMVRTENSGIRVAERGWLKIDEVARIDELLPRPPVE